MKRKTKIGCSAGLIFLLLLFGGGMIALNWGVKKVGVEVKREVARVAGPEVAADVPSGWTLVKEGLASGGTTIATLVRGEVRYQVPGVLWHNELRALFPIEEDVAGFVKLRLSNPTMVADGDPTWLRLNVTLEAVVYQGGNERFPGHVSVRTQLHYERGAGRLVLENPTLVEFTFAGAAGVVASSLRDVLAEALASELEDFEVFSFSQGGPWLEESGAKYVKDVEVANGGVVLVIGW